jgi:hypothetical protein
VCTRTSGGCRPVPSVAVHLGSGRCGYLATSREPGRCVSRRPRLAERRLRGQRHPVPHPGGRHRHRRISQHQEELTKAVDRLERELDPCRAAGRLAWLCPGGGSGGLLAWSPIRRGERVPAAGSASVHGPHPNDAAAPSPATASNRDVRSNTTRGSTGDVPEKCSGHTFRLANGVYPAATCGSCWRLDKTDAGSGWATARAFDRICSGVVAPTTTDATAGCDAR